MTGNRSRTHQINQIINQANCTILLWLQLLNIWFDQSTQKRHCPDFKQARTQNRNYKVQQRKHRHTSVAKTVHQTKQWLSENLAKPTTSTSNEKIHPVLTDSFSSPTSLKPRLWWKEGRNEKRELLEPRPNSTVVCAVELLRPQQYYVILSSQQVPWCGGTFAGNTCNTNHDILFLRKATTGQPSHPKCTFSPTVLVL